MSDRPAWIGPAVVIAAGAVTFAVAFHSSGSGSDDVVQLAGHSGGNSGIRATAATAPAAVTPAASARAPTAARSTDLQAAPDLPTRTKITKSASKDPFAPKGWLPPPPPSPPAPVTAAPPPPPPTAPPVPFRFVGLFEEKSAKPAAFIAKGEALYVVRVGDVVESTYRIESFNSAQVVVTYLPLQQRQTIEVTGG